MAGRDLATCGAGEVARAGGCWMVTIVERCGGRGMMREWGIVVIGYKGWLCVSVVMENKSKIILLWK